MLNTAERQSLLDLFDLRHGKVLHGSIKKFIDLRIAEHTESALRLARIPTQNYMAGQHSSVVEELEGFLVELEKFAQRGE